MSQLLKHRNFQGTVMYSAEDKVLHGRVVGVRGLISYEGESVADLEADFRLAVDDYIADMQQEGRAAIPASEVIPVVFSPALHERAIRFAEAHHQELTDIVEQAVSQFIEHAA
jgi:predicted HicB family RNase H-like nuclease